MVTGQNAYVMIVEDHPLVAESLAACVRACQADLDILIFESLLRALDTLSKWPAPQLILTDLTLTDADGMESVRQLRKAAPHTKLLVCTALDTPALREEAQALGATGYLIKNTATSVLREEISRAIGAPPLTMNIQRPRMQKINRLLTARQISILEELSSGRSNKEIAARLDIALDTVGSHMKEIFVRLGARNRTEAVAHYLQLKSHPHA